MENTTRAHEYHYLDSGDNDFVFHPIVALILCIIGVLTCLCIVLGNILVCAAVATIRKLRHDVANYLLVSLAISDMLVGLCVMPPAIAYALIGGWYLGTMLCRVWTICDVTLCTASILNLCIISVDRYLTITRPLTYAVHSRTGIRMLYYVGIVWSVSVLVSATPHWILTTPAHEYECQVNQNVFYQIYATMAAFYVPSTIIIFVNYKIYRAARNLQQSEPHRTVTIQNDGASSPNLLLTVPHTNGDADVQLNGHARRTRASVTAQRVAHFVGRQLSRTHLYTRTENHNTKAIKVLIIITGAFIFCWLPFFILALLKPTLLTPHNIHIPLWLDWMVLTLGWMNSLLNPFIYARYNRDFRTPFQEMLCCRCATMTTVCRQHAYNDTYGYSDRQHSITVTDDQNRRLTVDLNENPSTQPVNI